MDRLKVHQVDATGTPASGTVLRGDAAWGPVEYDEVVVHDNQVPVILMEASDTIPGDVPAGTPVGSLIFQKA